MPTLRMIPTNGGSIVALLSGSDLAPTTPVGGSNVLRDNDDSTYVSVTSTGSSVVSAGMWTICNVVGAPDAVTLLGLVPVNSTNYRPTFIARVKKAADCDEASPYVEAWIRDPSFETKLADIPLTGEFVDREVPVLEQADGSAWTLVSFNSANNFLGLVAQTSCAAGPSDEMGALWSRMFIDVEFDLPEPTLTLLPVGDLTPVSATLTATVNPNQETFDPVALVSYYPEYGFLYPYEYGYSYSTSRTLPGVTYVGTLTGTTDPIQVTQAIAGLTPATLYYYQLSVRDEDGNVTSSEISTFTTPLTDPIKGVY